VESKLRPLGTSATDWPTVPAPGDYDDGEFGGLKIGRGNRSTRRKPAPAPLYFSAFSPTWVKVMVTVNLFALILFWFFCGGGDLTLGLVFSSVHTDSARLLIGYYLLLTSTQIEELK
jgi:hypothetical protein